MSSGKPIIELKNVGKTFQSVDGDVVALKNVNISIEEGDIFGIIGMSGAGKSTLVRCINLLERPTEGSVFFDGSDLMTLKPAELRTARKKISMIFQQFNLLMQKTCLKNICFPMEIAGVKPENAKKRALELLEIVGLPDKANAYPAQLSGGQKQRIAIARALASDPKVLMCDEATSALDPKTTRAILELIKDINKNLGITAIIITHEMGVIEEICSDVAILEQGSVEEIGKVEEIFSNPKTEAAKRLVYPDGLPEKLLKSERAIRIAFNGGTSYDPLIASLAIDCGVKVNILGADTRNVGGKAFGTMIIGLPNDPEQAKKALDYLSRRSDITFEEVEIDG